MEFYSNVDDFLDWLLNECGCDKEDDSSKEKVENKSNTSSTTKTTEDYKDIVKIDTFTNYGVYKYKECYILRFNYVGLNGSDFIVENTENTISIKVDAKKSNDDNCTIVYDTLSNYENTIITFNPKRFNSDKIEANMIDGLLSVKLPFAEVKEPRKIKIM